MNNINKKAILGFAMTMIFSLAFMQGISTKNNQDISMQQLSIGASYMSGYAEDGSAAEAAWAQASDVMETTAGIAATGLAAAWVLSGTNPVGWGTWLAVGGVFL